MIPLFFQVVLLDSASKAGMRLVVPSIATPIGGLVAGFVMSRWGMLSHLVRLGCFFMILGNGLVASLKFHDSEWKYLVYLFPANLGQGIVYPSILFTNIAAFSQPGEFDGWSQLVLWLTFNRTSRIDLNGVPLPIDGYSLGSCSSIDDHTKHPIFPLAKCTVRNTR